MRRLALAAVLIGGLFAAGCGAESRENLLRPPIPEAVSVHVAGEAVTISPSEVAFGPQERQEVIENHTPGVVPIDPSEPLPVNLTIANTLGQQIRIALIGPERRLSGPVTATGTSTFETTLTSGRYEVRVVGAGESDPAVLRVGPRRLSPQNDLAVP